MDYLDTLKSARAVNIMISDNLSQTWFKAYQKETEKYQGSMDQEDSANLAFLGVKS